MSPELFDPDRFNLATTRPTEKSDCYALGMVIYEVLTGKEPFFNLRRVAAVIHCVLVRGRHPEKPQGFSPDIWEILKRCWEPQPNDRPSLDTVLHFLRDVTQQWTSLRISFAKHKDMNTETDSNNQPHATVSFSGMLPPSLPAPPSSSDSPLTVFMI